MRTKLFCIALCLFMAGTMVFATGSRQSAASTGTPTLQIGIQRMVSVTDFVDNSMTRLVEKVNNVKLDFYYFPATNDEFITRFSLLAASNDLPETIVAGFIGGNEIAEFGANGFLIALNRYMDDPSKTPVFNQLPRAHREAMISDLRFGDGNIYSFGTYQPYTWDQTVHRLFINRQWLSRLGLQAPTTTDQLRNVLIAFRDRDPNGNGLRDEMGIVGVNYPSYGMNAMTSLINSFIYYDGLLALDSTGSNVITPVTDPNFRKALQWLNGLYREGLIEPSTFTLDDAGYKALLNADPAVVGFTSVAGAETFVDVRDNPNFLAMAPILPGPLTGPDGIGFSPYNKGGVYQRGFITNKAKDVDLAVKVMDSNYRMDISLVGFMGEENVVWTRDPAKLAGLSNPYVVSGQVPAVTWAGLTTENVWYRPNAMWWGNVHLRYMPTELQAAGGQLYPPLFDPNNYTIPPLEQVGIDTEKYYIPRHPQYILPELRYSAADTEAIAEATVNISSYVDRSIAEFITGARDISNDTAWNAYLRELDNMGLQQWVRIAQAQYNRQR